MLFAGLSNTCVMLVILGKMPSLFLYWRKQESGWLTALWMGGSGALETRPGSLIEGLLQPSGWMIDRIRIAQ
jgi:hypothetical protein